MELVWKYERLSSIPFLKPPIPFQFGIFHILHQNFHSILYHDEELVVQNLRREPHSSVTVRRFCKLKSCCYVIVIPLGWHRCPNPNCNAIKQKKVAMYISFQIPAYCITVCTTHLRIEPGCRGSRAQCTNH